MPKMSHSVYATISKSELQKTSGPEHSDAGCSVCSRVCHMPGLGKHIAQISSLSLQDLDEVASVQTGTQRGMER